MEEKLSVRVLDYLRSVEGSTAWAMQKKVGAGSREEVSRALRRLKRKGLARPQTKGCSFWVAAK